MFVNLGCDPFPRSLDDTRLPHETEGRPHKCYRQMGQGGFLNDDMMHHNMHYNMHHIMMQPNAIAE